MLVAMSADMLYSAEPARMLAVRLCVGARSLAIESDRFSTDADSSLSAGDLSLRLSK